KQAPGLAAAYTRHLFPAHALPLAEESDRVRLGHVEGIVGAEHDVIGAPDLDQMLQLALVEYDGAEIELLQILRRRLLDVDAAVLAMGEGVVEAAPIGRQVAAAMRDANLQ